MPAVVYATAFGGPEVLSVLDEPTGEPGPGQVRIEVKASGVNPIDFKLYSGAFGTDPSRLPLRLGLEAAGVVTVVGPDAVGPAGPISVGDEVIGTSLTGAYAAELVAPASAFVPKPAAQGWAEAAGLLSAGATAIHLLAATQVAAGDTVLMHGASGGVGQLAVQLAVSRGATVIATASPARQEFLRELGAEPVVYGDGLLERVQAIGLVDVALDLVGTDEAMDVSLALVADRDRIATIAGFARGFAAGIKVLGGGPGADRGDDIRQAARLELVDLVGAGQLKVLVSKTYPLVEVAAAHEESRAGHTLGKIALIP